MKEQYLRELEARLSNRMSPQELENVMQYYREYFDEAGSNKVSEVIGQLGSPAALVRRIMGEPTIEEQGRDEDEYPGSYPPPTQYYYRRGINIFLALFLTVMIAPVLMGLGGGLLGLGAGGVAAAGAGVWCVLMGVGNIFASGIPTVMVIVGGGMLAAGIGILLLAATVVLSKLFWRATAALFRWMYGGREIAA
ncbi:MAG: DUF1700 domain-containing protein [Clostridia bacterium]|nr:DUF1700 domain-containing protein [Clostridia bacterium]